MALATNISVFGSALEAMSWERTACKGMQLRSLYPPPFRRKEEDDEGGGDRAFPRRDSPPRTPFPNPTRSSTRTPRRRRRRSPRGSNDGRVSPCRPCRSRPATYPRSSPRPGDPDSGPTAVRDCPWSTTLLSRRDRARRVVVCARLLLAVVRRSCLVVPPPSRRRHRRRRRPSRGRARTMATIASGCRYPTTSLGGGMRLASKRRSGIAGGTAVGRCGPASANRRRRRDYLAGV